MVDHVLSDGSRVDNVAGKVIKAEDHRTLYELMVKIFKEGEKTEIVSAPD